MQVFNFAENYKNEFEM